MSTSTSKSGATSVVESRERAEANMDGNGDAATDVVTMAEDHLAAGDYELAEGLVRRQLIHSPADPGLQLLAAKIAGVRGDPELALSLIGESPQSASISLELWQLLNRLGLRHQACEIVDARCRAGSADDQMMWSLIRRGHSFPPDLPPGRRAEELFAPGLGIARWHFTRSEYQLALRTLEAGPDHADQDQSELAFFGRLLAETQAYDRMPAWYARCGRAAREHADFWAAIGLFFDQRNEHRAAAGALLQAVYRDPTDRTSFQRLSKVFEALKRPEDAAQFRFAGVEIAQTETRARLIRTEPQNIAVHRRAISQILLKLYRPFESLQWARLSLSPSDTAPRLAIESQRRRLQADPRAAAMASQAALMQIDRDDFSTEAAIASTLGNKAAPASSTASDFQAGRRSNDDDRSVPHFENVAASRGLDFQYYHSETIELGPIPISEMTGGGIAVIDYDIDGWPDVYFAQGSGKLPQANGTRPNRLMRNIGGMFGDVTAASATGDTHYSCTVTAGDVNQDGFADLWIGNLGPNRLLINNGDGTFRDATATLGPHDDTFTTSLAVADLDGDTLPDLYEANYIEIEGAFTPPRSGPDGRPVQQSPLEFYAQPDRWFRSRGDGSFESRGIDPSVAPPGSSLGLLVTDFDADHKNEVLVGNDARPNHLLQFDGHGGVKNMADAKGIAYGFEGAATGCMGIAGGDFNRDGAIDVHITNFLGEPSNLYVQGSGGAFTDLANRYGVASLSRPYVGFGSKSIDVDNDGRLEIAITNGHIFDATEAGEPFRMPPQLLSLSDGQFEMVAVEDPSGYWQSRFVGRAMSTLDFNRDGKIDLLVGHLDAPAALLHNRTEPAGDWIQLELIGVASERDAIGAKVTVATDQGDFSHWMTAGGGYLSRDEAIIHIGLGQKTTIISIQVDWPSGATEVLLAPQKNQRLVIVEKESQFAVHESP